MGNSQSGDIGLGLVDDLFSPFKAIAAIPQMFEDMFMLIAVVIVIYLVIQLKNSFDGKPSFGMVKQGAKLGLVA